MVRLSSISILKNKFKFRSNHKPSSDDMTENDEIAPVHLLPKWEDPNHTREKFSVLEPVQDAIILSLFQVRPSLVIRLNKSYYSKYIPGLYKDIEVVDRIFDGLFRSWSRGCADDNSTIRAFKHVNTLHMLKTSGAHGICTVTSGDQPVFVPHSNLFENAQRVEIGWDVYVSQGDKSLYYMYLGFADQLGEQLKQGTMNDLVIEVKDGSRVYNHRLIFREFDQGLKSPIITCLINPPRLKPNNDNKRTLDSICIPMVTLDLKYCRRIRFIIPQKLGSYDYATFNYQIRESFRNYTKWKNEHGHANDILKIEYYVYNSTEIKDKVIKSFRDHGRNDIRAWMTDRIDFKDVEEVRQELRWSKVWRLMAEKYKY